LPPSRERPLAPPARVLPPLFRLLERAPVSRGGMTAGSTIPRPARRWPGHGAFLPVPSPRHHLALRGPRTGWRGLKIHPIPGTGCRREGGHARTTRAARMELLNESSKDGPHLSQHEARTVLRVRWQPAGGWTYRAQRSLFENAEARESILCATGVDNEVSPRADGRAGARDSFFQLLQARQDGLRWRVGSVDAIALWACPCSQAAEPRSARIGLRNLTATLLVSTGQWALRISVGVEIAVTNRLCRHRTASERAREHDARCWCVDGARAKTALRALRASRSSSLRAPTAPVIANVYLDGAWNGSTTSTRSATSTQRPTDRSTPRWPVHRLRPLPGVGPRNWAIGRCSLSSLGRGRCPARLSRDGRR